MSNPKTDAQATNTKAINTKGADAKNTGKQTQTKKPSQAQEANRLITKAVIQLTLVI